MGRPFQSFIHPPVAVSQTIFPFSVSLTQSALNLCCTSCIPLEVKEMFVLDGTRQDSGGERPVNIVKSQKKQKTLHQLQFVSCTESAAMPMQKKPWGLLKEKKKVFFSWSLFSCKAFQNHKKKFYSLLTSKCCPWGAAAELTSGQTTQVSHRGASMCWGTRAFTIATSIPHHQVGEHHGGLRAPQPRCHSGPVLLFHATGCQAGLGSLGANDGGIRIPAPSLGRSPSPGWDPPWPVVLAPCPESWEAVAPRPGLWGPSAFSSLLRPRILVAPFIAPVAGVRKSRCPQWRWAPMAGFNESSQWYLASTNQ